MRLYIDLKKAGPIKPPKPPKVPGAPEPAGEDASNKTAVTAGSSEDYDYVSKQQYGERPPQAVGETDNSWIVPKGAVISTTKEDFSEEDNSQEEESTSKKPKQEEEITQEPLSKEETSDPLVDTQGKELGATSLELDENEANTIPKNKKEFSGKKDGPSMQDPVHRKKMQDMKDDLTDFREQRKQSANKKEVDKKQQDYIKDARKLEKEHNTPFNNDFDALIDELNRGDEAKDRRDKLRDKEKQVVGDVLKDDGTGFKPKTAKKESTEATTVTPNKSKDPNLSRTKDREGEYDIFEHGEASKQQAAKDYAEQQYSYKDSKDKYEEARAKHTEAVESYNKKKKNAEEEQNTYNENKEAHQKAKNDIKDNTKKLKKDLVDKKDALKELKANPESSIKDHKKLEREIDKISQDIEKENTKLDRLDKKEPKKPERFSEKEPKFKEKEPEAPEMRSPSNEMEHMQWQDHVRGASKLAEDIEVRLQDKNITPQQKKRLEMLHERLSYHSGLHSMPTAQQVAEYRNLQKMAKEAGAEEISDETPEEKANKTKGKLTLPSNIGRRIGQVGTTAEAASDIPAIISDYGIGGASKVATRLLDDDSSDKENEESNTRTNSVNSAADTKDPEDNSAANENTPDIDPGSDNTDDSGNAEFDDQGALGATNNPSKKGSDNRVRTPEELEGKDRPEPSKTPNRAVRTPEQLDGNISSRVKENNTKKPKLRLNKEDEEFGKSMIYIDLSKGIGPRPNVAVDSNKDKEQQDSQYTNSFERRGAGTMGDMSPDKEDVGKDWKAVDDEENDVKKKLQDVTKSVTDIFTIYSTEKKFLNSLGYSDDDILNNRVYLKKSDYVNFQNHLVSNLSEAIANLKKSL